MTDLTVALPAGYWIRASQDFTGQNWLTVYAGCNPCPVAIRTPQGEIYNPDGFPIPTAVRDALTVAA